MPLSSNPESWEVASFVTFTPSLQLLNMSCPSSVKVRLFLGGQLVHL